MTLANVGGFPTQRALLGTRYADARNGVSLFAPSLHIATRFARIALSLLLVLALLCGARAAHAVGTPAGTTITNAATINYSVAGVPATANTNVVSFRVDELISVRVTPPAAPTAVNSPDTNRTLLFTVSNVGNGPEAFTLTPNLNPPVADQFNPQTGAVGILFVDTNGNGQLDIGVDTPISGPLAINPDQSVPVLFVSNIPPGVANGGQGVVTLTAASATPGAVVSGAGVAPGTILPNGGTPAVGGPGIDAVIGAGTGGIADSGADDTATGSYVVSGVNVAIAKTVIAVTSPFGVTTTGCNAPAPPAACNSILPGTAVQYQLTVTLTGAGIANNVLVTDNIPANTTYVAQSMRLNGTPQTDQAGDDNASCAGCGNAVGAVTISLGNVTVSAGTPVTHVVDYRVTIN